MSKKALIILKNLIKKRFYGVLILLGVLGVSAIFILLYWQKITNSGRLASFLPEQRTLGFVEFNLDPSHRETAQLSEWLGQNQTLNNHFQQLQQYIPHSDLFHQWWSGRGGLAVLSDSYGQRPELLIFLQQKDHGKVLEWINELVLDPGNDSLLEETYQGQKLLSFRSGQVYHLMLSGDWLILTENRDNLKLIAETLTGQHQSLHKSADYLKLASALPDQNIGWLYLNRNQTLNLLSHSSALATGDKAFFQLLLPMFRLFNSEAVSIQLTDNVGGAKQLEFKHLALFNRDKLSPPNLFNIDYFYHGYLDSLLPAGTGFHWGGVNMPDQANKLRAAMSGQSALDKVMQAGIRQAFQDFLTIPGGEPVDLDKFFSILSQEFLVFGRAVDDNAEFGMIIQSDNPADNLLTLQPFLRAIGSQLAGLLYGQARSFTLPDGTVGEELSPELTAAAFSTISIAGHPVEQLSISPSLNIYALVNSAEHYLLITTSSPLLEDMISLKPSSKSVSSYGLDKPLEVYHMNISDLPPLNSDLHPLKSVSIAKKFTEIGVLGVYQLKF